MQTKFKIDGFSPDTNWPRVSVVVCVCNGESTIELCLRELAKIDYPNFHALIVDDGSTDATVSLVKQSLYLHPEFRLIELGHNQGLSAARNVGMAQAEGEIIAYLDSDAYPDRLWLKHVAQLFLNSKYVAVGGPNLNPPASGLVADCVDQSPGSPDCVLINAMDADHIPGCNLAIRTPFLRAMGGFNPTYRAAGDDVDVCWRIQKFGGTLGYADNAIVWHYRRDTVRGYLKQQRGYGRAEAILFRHWPEKFNRLGHVRWNLASMPVVYGTTSIYGSPGRIWDMLPQIPEWNLWLLATLLLSMGGLVWPPLWGCLVLFILSLGLSFNFAFRKAKRAKFAGGWRRRAVGRGLTTFFFLVQPMARLRGRMEYGLTPWMSRNGSGT